MEPWAEAAWGVLGARVRAWPWPAQPGTSAWHRAGQSCEEPWCKRGYSHIDEKLIVLVVFGEVGLNELLGACEGFVPTATKQCHSKEAQASGNQGSKGCPNETSGTALE